MARLRHLIAVLVAASLPAEAQERTPATATAPTVNLTPSGADPAPAEGDRVDFAVKVSLRFHGNPELTGDYRVNPDGSLSVPVIGRIPVRGLTLARLEQALNDRLAEITGRETHVTVEIAEYRPIYVTGFVNHAGPRPWQPGLTVLQAVSLAEGIYRAPGTMDIAGFSNIGRYGKALDDRKRGMAVLARLRAERAGARTIEVPKELVELVGKAEAERLIAAQNSLFVSRNAALDDKIAALERGRALANQEIQSLKEQAQRVKEQLAMRSEYRQKIADLQKRGLAVAERGLEQDIRVAELEERTTNGAVAMARVQATLAGLDREMVTLKQERRAQIDTEIARLERDIAQLGLETEAAAMADRESQDRASREAGRRAVLAFSIVRREGREATTLPATETTPLKPDDVLIVSQDYR